MYTLRPGTLALDWALWALKSICFEMQTFGKIKYSDSHKYPLKMMWYLLHFYNRQQSTSL